MRILHVIGAFGRGGAEVSVAQLAQALKERGHDCLVGEVLAPRTRSSAGTRLRDECSESGVSVLGLGRAGKSCNLMLACLRLAAAIRRWKPDLVHSHTDVPDFVVSVTGRMQTFRIVRTIRNTQLWPTKQLVGRFVERSFCDDLVVSVGWDAHEAYERLRARYGLPLSSRRAIINTGIRVPSVSREEARLILADTYQADLARAQMCFVGRFVSQKGLDVLLAALERVPPRHAQLLEIHCFGEGPLFASLEQAANSGFPVKVHPPDHLIAELLSAFDFTLVPSRFEGLARVSLESLIAGTPVIASDAPGLRETLPADWPFVFPVEDPAALALILARAAAGAFTGELDSLRSHGARWARGRFSLEAMVEAYESVYKLYLEGERFCLDLRAGGSGGLVAGEGTQTNDSPVSLQ